MPLTFPVPTALPGVMVHQITDIPLVEIRHPASITFWYIRKTDKGEEQVPLSLSLRDMRIKYPADYSAVFTALKKVAYLEVVASGLAPAGGTVT